MEEEKNKGGRPRIRVKERKKAQKMAEAGLTYREISRALLNREDPKTIWRWLKGPYANK